MTLIINLEFEATTTDTEQYEELREWVKKTFFEDADWKSCPANVVDKFVGVKISFPYLQETLFDKEDSNE